MVKDDSKPKIFSYSDHAGREDLIGEHKIGDIGQLIGLIIFMIVWILDSFIYHRGTFLSEHGPLYVRLIISIPLFIVAGYVARKGLKEVFENVRDPPEVITTGVFSFSRHPIYLSEIIVYLSLFIATLSLFSLLVLFLVYLFLNYIAKSEEKLLIEHFGEEYEKYMKKVPRWFLF